MADIKVDEYHTKLDKKNREILSPFRIRFEGISDEDKDYRLLAQDCILHKCNRFCLDYIG